MHLKNKKKYWVTYSLSSECDFVFIDISKNYDSYIQWCNLQPQPLVSCWENFHCIHSVVSQKREGWLHKSSKEKIILIIYPSTWWKDEHRNIWPTLLGLVLPACLSSINSQDSSSSCSLFSCSHSSIFTMTAVLNVNLYINLDFQLCVFSCLNNLWWVQTYFPLFES